MRRGGGIAAGAEPLEVARELDLGRFAGWLDGERLPANLHRAYSELRGEPRGIAVPRPAVADMIAFNDGRRRAAWHSDGTGRSVARRTAVPSRHRMDWEANRTMTDLTKTKADLTADLIDASKKITIDWTKLDEIPADTRGRFFTMGARINGLEKQRKVARYRQFEFYCDEPPILGGEDAYPQPLTYLVAGVGFCLLTQVVRYAAMLKKTITNVECDCEFDTHVDDSVLRGDVQASVTEFRVHLCGRIAGERRRHRARDPAGETWLLRRSARPQPVPMVSTCELNGQDFSRSRSTTDAHERQNTSSPLRSTEQAWGVAHPILRRVAHRQGLDAVDEVRAQAPRAPASSMSGRRRSNSSNITRISSRARLAPRQKWCPPPPNARCGFGLARDVEAAGVGEHVLVAVGGRVEHHDLVALADLLAADLGVARGGAPEVDHRRHPPQHLLDGVRHQRRVGEQAAALRRDAP